MKSKILTISSIFLIIAIGNYFRFIANGNVRMVEFLSIFAIGVLTGVVITEIAKIVKSKREN
jgi:multisubunit Na+/H+ antiporter MnhG subunit